MADGARRPGKSTAAEAAAPGMDAAEALTARLHGREDVIAELVSSTKRGGPPLTVVSGEAGSGRSAILDALRRELAGARVLNLNASEHDRRTAFGALYRLLSDLDGPDPSAAGVRTSVLGVVARLSGSPSAAAAPSTATQLAMAVFSAARRYLPLVVLIDDAQWLDDATAALLEPLVQHMSGSPISMVLTVRSDVARDAVTAPLRRLRDAGLARTRTLRPLTRRQSQQIIAETVRANPDATLVDELHRASRGLPAALVAGLAGHRESRSLRIVDRHAYLVRTNERPVVSGRHPLLLPVRDAGEVEWATARAMSVLAPLGSAAPLLIAESANVEQSVARESIDRLVRLRVLVPAGEGWRFRVPMVRAALEASLGPFERRNLAALAVTALWGGSAEADDPGYLPDRLVDAGKLVDPQRAGQELLAHGVQAMFDDGGSAVRWLRSATEKVTEPQARALTLLAHAGTCTMHYRAAEAADSIRLLLWRHAEDLPFTLLQQAEVIYLVSAAATGDCAELARIADGTGQPLPGGPAQRMVARVVALAMLERWDEAGTLLAAQRAVWTGGDPVTEDFGNIALIGATVSQGDTTELFRFVDQPELWRARDVPDQHFEEIRHQTNMLLGLGELDRALGLLRRNEFATGRLSGTDQFQIEFMRGEWFRAMATARRTMATAPNLSRPMGQPMMYLGAALLHTEGGMLSRARQMIETGRAGPMPYLFDFAEARVSQVLGELDAADESLRTGLARADAAGVAFGTEHIWAHVAVRANERGDVDEAKEALRRLEKLAEGLGTGKARIAHLLTRMRVLGDTAAAEQAVVLARRRGQPYETTLLFTLLAQAGYRTAELLPEAYRLSDGLGALLLRSRLRQVMRDHNVPIPSRGATTAENERLLAVLVTEGLTNRQMAVVFGATEKSVEGRLTRMFARIGYRSRVELAAAMLTGEYPG